MWGAGGRRRPMAPEKRAGDNEWGALMKAHSEGGEGDGSGGGGTTAAVVGVGRARERVGPGKWRRVATLARWEPSARAHMLSITLR